MTTAMNEAEKLARMLELGDDAFGERAAALLRRQAEQIKLLREALGIAERFCGSLTSDECPDSVHAPIRSALAATKEET